jgi:imidazolonepropionase-like amidohydrolase
VNYVRLRPLDVLKCATRTGAEILGRSHELGALAKGRLADVLVVDGDVVADVSILQDRSRLMAVVQSGIIKSSRG